MFDGVLRFHRVKINIVLFRIEHACKDASMYVILLGPWTE